MGDARLVDIRARRSSRRPKARARSIRGARPVGVDAVVVGEQDSHGPPFRTRLGLRRARSAMGDSRDRETAGGRAEPIGADFEGRARDPRRRWRSYRAELIGRRGRCGSPALLLHRHLGAPVAAQDIDRHVGGVAAQEEIDLFAANGERANDDPSTKVRQARARKQTRGVKSKSRPRQACNSASGAALDQACGEQATG